MKELGRLRVGVGVVLQENIESIEKRVMVIKRNTSKITLRMLG